MILNRFLFIVAIYFACYLEACVIPIQENEETATSNVYRAASYKIFK